MTKDLSDMKKITIYTKLFCPFCVRAKHLLTSKGQDFDEIDLGQQPDQRDVMIARAGGAHTVPQIFFGDDHIGGCDDLMALEESGKLDQMLA